MTRRQAKKAFRRAFAWDPPKHRISSSKAAKMLAKLRKRYGSPSKWAPGPKRYARHWTRYDDGAAQWPPTGPTAQGWWARELRKYGMFDRFEFSSC